MQKLTALLLALIMAGSLTACGGAASSTPASSAADSTATEPAAPEETAPAETGLSGEIIVFAAASMTETLTELKEIGRAHV